MDTDAKKSDPFTLPETNLYELIGKKEAAIATLVEEVQKLRAENAQLKVAHINK